MRGKKRKGPRHKARAMENRRNGPEKARIGAKNARDGSRRLMEPIGRGGHLALFWGPSWRPIRQWGWRQVQVSLLDWLEQLSASWLPTTPVRLPTLGCGDQTVPDVDQKQETDRPTNILVHPVRRVSRVGSGVGPRRTGPEIRHRGTAASHRVGLRSASRWSPHRGRRRMLRRGRSTNRSSSTFWTWLSSSATC